MRNIITLTEYTFREALSRKIFITFFAVSTFVLVIMSLLFLTVGIEDLMPVVQVNGQNQMGGLLDEVAVFFKMLIVVPLYGGGLFLAIFSVSSFIPNMLEKGSIDLLLSKPLSRSQIIFGKFFGGTLMVFVNVAYLVIGIWFLIGLKFGIWDTGLLLTIFSITFTFMVIYSMIILVGILTRSSILAMMLSYLIFFIFSPLLYARDKIFMLFDNKFVEYLVDAVYYVLPKTQELGMTTGAIAKGDGITDFQPLITSFLFLILNLFLSIFIFSKKDY